jgi:hypothetical protein
MSPVAALMAAISFVDDIRPCAGTMANLFAKKN